ncbi:MAG TPA: hypothetical protein VEU11_17125 [Terriglobales bacterium]|nr:hypothetical protein [Terriglobales bacterium]
MAYVALWFRAPPGGETSIAWDWKSLIFLGEDKRGRKHQVTTFGSKIKLLSGGVVAQLEISPLNQGVILESKRHPERPSGREGSGVKRIHLFPGQGADARQILRH